MRYYFFLILVLTSTVALSQNNSVFSLRDFYCNNKNLDSLVNKIFELLGDTQRVGQMIMPAGGGLGKSTAELEKLAKSGYIGGILYLKTSKEDVEKMNKIFSDAAKSGNNLPLLFSTDGEPSLINNKIKGLNPFKKTSLICSAEESGSIGKEIAMALKGLNIYYNLAPVCDIAINKEIINNRSYGNDKTKIIDFSKAFIKATQCEGIIATAKHFPGHGNVKGDSHLNLVCIDGEMIELDAYKALIADSVLSILVGHIAIKNNEKYSTDGVPSTCCRKIVTDLLKTEMGFKGLIITDGMQMGAMNKIQNATLKAVEAGCDIILIPGNEIKLVKQILSKMAKDADFKNQVFESSKKIIRAKICLGLISVN